MKIGWLLWDEYGDVQFFKDHPRDYTGELVQIVYAEILE